MIAALSQRVWYGSRRPWIREASFLPASGSRYPPLNVASTGKLKADTLCWKQPVQTSKCIHRQPAAAQALPPHVSARQPSPEAWDDHFMALAIEEAQLALQQKEVPVGAVLTVGSKVISRAHNQTEQTGNPIAHAEMLCIQDAAAKLGGWRLLDSSLYVTLEPCPMCAGALLQSRVGRVIYGARNTLLGAHGSWIALLPAQSSSNLDVARPQKSHPFHDSMQVRGGVMADTCSELMRGFFQNRRQRLPRQTAQLVPPANA